MNVEIKIDIDKKGIMRVCGLGNDKGAQKFLASEVARLSDPYVPMQQGHLKNLHTIASDGSEIVYNQPYAHYQYYGEAMAGRAPKKYTGKTLDYHGAPMRGPNWDKRMFADKQKEIEKSVSDYIERKCR